MLRLLERGVVGAKRPLAFRQGKARVAIDRGGRALRTKEALRRLATPAGAVGPIGAKLPIKRRDEVRGALASPAPPVAVSGPAKARAFEHGADRFVRFGGKRD